MSSNDRQVMGRKFLAHAQKVATECGVSVTTLGYWLLYQDHVVDTACGTVKDFKESTDAEERAMAPGYKPKDSIEEAVDSINDGAARDVALGLYDELTLAGEIFDHDWRTPIASRPEYHDFVARVAREEARRKRRKR